MDRTVERTKVAVVGAGPIGIEVAVALKKAGVEYVHLDAGQIGSTMEWWAPNTTFFSSPERIAIAGVPLVTPDQDKATREQYLTYLRTVVAQFDLPIRTYTRVEAIEPQGQGGYLLRTRGSSDGVGGPAELERMKAETTDSPARRNGDVEPAPEGEILADNIVLAIGDMQRPRLIGIPGEHLPHVSHFFQDPHHYFRKRVLIVGAKNSAAEAAIRLYRVGCDLTICHRGGDLDKDRIKYWIYPELRWLINKDRITFLPRTAPTEIHRGRVALAPTDNDFAPIRHQAKDHPFDFVLLLTGYEQDPTLFEMAGVELVGEQRRPRFDRKTMQTNAPGVYVAGTATAGTQIGGVKVFIETCHQQPRKIVASILGKPAPDESEIEEISLPES